MQLNGDLILNEYTAADSAIYDCIVCSSSGDALTFISAVKTQVKRSGSGLLALLETEFGSATEANQLAGYSLSTDARCFFFRRFKRLSVKTRFFTQETKWQFCSSVLHVTAYC